MLRFVLVIVLWSVLAPLLGTIRFLSRARSPHWSWPYHLFALFMQRVTPAAVALPPRRLRRFMDLAGALFVRLIASRPRRVEVGGVPCAWFGHRDEGPVVIYLHGGGYAVGSPNTHGHPLALLARMTRTRLLAIDYRLAPEHPHPHALEDTLAAYRALLDTGISADQVALAGESAGGGLALATALALRDAEEPLPAAIACLSPWVDLTDTAPELAGEAPHDFVIPALLGEWGRSYAGAADRTDPALSPGLADLAGLPPLLVLLGGGEVLRGQGERFAEAAARAGVDVHLEVWPDMVHAWPMFPVLPESRRALRQVATFLRSQLTE